MEKIINARLKEPISAAVKVDLDFNEDWLKASAIMEQYKRNLLSTIRDELHSKIATLSLDDIEFKINKP